MISKTKSNEVTMFLYNQAPALIVNCGVQLLLSLSVMVRSPIALEMNQVQSLYVHAPAISSDIKVIMCDDFCLFISMLIYYN